MQICFLGPLNQVAGSCYWLRDPRLGLTFLIDCGATEGERGPRYCEKFPFDPSTIDFVLLTHAHRDHCGMLPDLVKQGFTGVVYCTEETAHLTRISLDDRTAEHVGEIRFGRIGDGTLLTAHEFVPGLRVAAYPSGHIIGAVSYRLSWDTPNGVRSIVFSGDIGPMPGRRGFTLTRPPVRPPTADYVVMESTYGDRPNAHGPHHLTSLMGQLAQLIDQVKRSRGVLLIPAFSIERTQTLQVVLDELCRTDPSVLDVPLYMHSPSARAMGATYAAALGGCWFDPQVARQLGEDCDDAGYEAVKTRIAQILWGRATNDGVAATHTKPATALRLTTSLAPVFEEFGGPAVVLASGGMLSGGTIMRYLPELLRRPNTVIALTGYISPATFGGWLADVIRAQEDGTCNTAENPAPPTSPLSEVNAEDVRAHLVRLKGYSGHADQRSLVDWAGGERFLATRGIFLTHGDHDARIALRSALYSQPSKRVPWIELPSDCTEWFDLDRGEWVWRS